MNFKITLDERKKIEELLNRGFSVKSISEHVKRSPYAVSEEIKKNGGIGSYNAENAQQKSNENRKQYAIDKNTPIRHLKKRMEELEHRIQIIEERLI